MKKLNKKGVSSQTIVVIVLALLAIILFAALGNSITSFFKEALGL